VDEYQNKIKPSDGHPVICPLSVALHHTLSRLRAVAMTQREVLFECQQVQRQWMELWALMDYIEIYKPCMEGRAPPQGKQPMSLVALSMESIRWRGIVQPKDVLVLDDYFNPFPCIYIGNSNSNRFRAISEHGLKSLCYIDLFSNGNRQGVRPLEFVPTGSTATQPSLDRRNTSARHQPCRLPLSKQRT
jgi:hypothetical protein